MCHEKGPVAFRVALQVIYTNINSGRDENNAMYELDANKFDIGCALGVVWWVFESISLMGGSVIGFERNSGTMDFGAVKQEYFSTSIGFMERRTGIGITFYLRKS